MHDFLTASEVISMKCSFGHVSNKSLEIMPEPGADRSGNRERDYRVSLQPPWALQDPGSKTTWNNEETNKGKKLITLLQMRIQKLCREANTKFKNIQNELLYPL